MIRSTASLLAVLVLGCASQSADDDASGGGAGGKADGESESGPMAEVDETTHSYMRAADAECLHMNYTRNETYDQGVKLICLPRGGVAAPIALIFAVTPIGEADGAYKVFELPHFISAFPESVAFRMVGNKAIYTFQVKTPNFSDESGEFLYDTKSVTATLEFSGSTEDPAVAAKYTIE